MTLNISRQVTDGMGERNVRVWDLYVRLFHWGLVASFAIAWLTAKDWHVLHHWSGYAAIALVAFRLVWGFAGTPYARFSAFVRSPAVVLDFLRAMWRREEPRYRGHNPAGAVMILALLGALLATGSTGWMMTLDAFWGVDWVEPVHGLLANAMLAMVVLHLGGVIWASRAHKENLARAMITGIKRADRRPAPATAAHDEPRCEHLAPQHPAGRDDRRQRIGRDEVR